MERRYVLGVPRLHGNGYFDDPLRRAAAAARYDGKYDLYFNLNPVQQQLLQVAENQVRVPNCWTARSKDIARRNAVVINLEPQGDPVGYHAALEKAEAVRQFMKYWPDPVVAESGNAISLIYAVDMPNIPAINR